MGNLSRLLAPALVLAATPCMAADLTISDPWLRDISPSLPAAGYFTLTNSGDKPMVLTGASSPVCGALMLHQTMQMNGTAQMDMVADLPVPAHGKLVFQPGGYHLMCMSPTAALSPGARVPVSLQLKDGSTVTATFLVRGPTGK